METRKISIKQAVKVAFHIKLWEMANLYLYQNSGNPDDEKMYAAIIIKINSLNCNEQIKYDIGNKIAIGWFRLICLDLDCSENEIQELTYHFFETTK